MAFNDAIKFISRVQEDSTLRTSLYLCDSALEINNHLQTLGYKFTFDELDDSYRKLLLQCQFEDDAQKLTEVYNMYRLLIGMNPVPVP